LELYQTNNMKVEINDLNFYYGSNHVLKDIFLQLPSGKLTVILGPSGCGKSTLLRCISGLESNFIGEVLFDDKNIRMIPQKKRNVSMVFQDIALYQTLTVRKNIALSLISDKLSKDEIDFRVKTISKELNIEMLLDKKVTKLSGGERQRASIAKSLIRRPNLFLLDEPFSDLDIDLKTSIRHQFSKLQKELKITSVMVTHDQDEAMELADNLVIINEGKIQQSGTTKDIYYNPSNKFVANFIGFPKMNFLDGIDLDSIINIPQNKLIAIRPENINLNKIAGMQQILIEGKLCEIIPRLPNYQLIFNTDYGKISIIENTTNLTVSSNYSLYFNPQDLIFINN